MTHTLTGTALLVLASSLAFGQPAPDSKLEFEVATVKPSPPPSPGRMMIGMRGGPGTPDPGQVNYTNFPLKFYITNAYDVKPYQVTGPAWLDTERFDMVAKVPAGATKEQVRGMMQNLLADRFGLKLHHDSKDSQVYELIVEKGGPKFKPSESQDDPPAPKADSAPPPPPGPPKMGKNGFPQLDRPGMIMMMTISPTGPRARLVGKGQTLADLANNLGNQVNRPVVDKTGLPGKYDFNLEFAFEPGSGGPAGLPSLPLPPPGAVGGGPAGPPPGQADSQTADSAPNIFTAVREQLGLKLDPKKAPLDILVIDQVNKTPTEN
jgi:uncharacterized protein (TIGR03435 family)